MGYTNYWYQRKSFTNEEWSKVLDEYDYLKDILGDVIVDETKEPFSVKAIVFNGNPKNNQDHETFILHKEAQTEPDYEGQDITFNFCKTAQKPYDVAVWHLISFAHYNTNAIWKISRDR